MRNLHSPKTVIVCGLLVACAAHPTPTPLEASPRPRVAIAVNPPTVDASPVVVERVVSGGSNKPRSKPLRNPLLHSPLPGGFVGGWLGDTGVDISAAFKPVYAMAAGTLDYSESGHTVWKYGHDTPNSVRLALDVPSNGTVTR